MHPSDMWYEHVANGVEQIVDIYNTYGYVNFDYFIRHMNDVAEDVAVCCNKQEYYSLIE